MHVDLYLYTITRFLLKYFCTRYKLQHVQVLIHIFNSHSLTPPLASICNSPPFSNSPSFHWPFKSPLQQKRQRELDCFLSFPPAEGEQTHIHKTTALHSTETQAQSRCTDLHQYITVYISHFLHHYLLSLLLVSVRFSAFKSLRKDPYWHKMY